MNIPRDKLHGSKRSSSLRRFSIKNRLLGAFFITSLLPVIFVTLYSNVRYEDSISEKLSAFSMQVLSESAVNVSRELAQYETLSESIIVNQELQNGLKRAESMTDYERNEFQTKINNVLGEQVFRLSNLSNVVVLTESMDTFFDLGFEWYPGSQVAESIKRINPFEGNTTWNYLRSNRGADKIALSRVIFSADNLNQKIGYLIIVIDGKVFTRNTYEHVDLGTGGKLYIVDGFGTVVSSADPNIAQGTTYKQEEVFGKITKGQANKSFYTQIDGKRVLVTNTYIRSADWYMVGLIPHTYIVSELLEIRGNLLYISLIILLLSTLMAMWVYRSISTPMRELLQYAKHIKLGRLDLSLSAETPPDEMGKLTETIAQMVGQLKQLIDQVGQEQKAKRDAELKMLQAQINPHFLFNTLNSLKWSAMMSGNTIVEEGIGSLSELLHNTILDQEEMIPLRKEIDNLLHYAVIQRIRYGQSFELNCTVERDELYECLVPRFILQPIVENSILHAGGDEGRVVKISVEITSVDRILQVAVADNGKGFDLKEVQSRRHVGNKLSGIGIVNVEERIHMYVGEPYGMLTRSEPGKGTMTVIRLPLKQKEG
ncbi:sensor histidine kinase [Paenibacillus sp. HW567]|uniref:sensor histidine kinase n=1 Tax=Paenibacillus sp. HW567 TaxID=1034769 RepID=UPI00039C36AE|nr:sensor histidine kinase [Paenibacillus sp. HW567]